MYGPVAGAGIRHGMSVVAVRGDLVDERPLAAAAVVQGEAGGLADRQDVHAVHLDAGNVVASRVERRGRGRPLLRRAHAVVVVLAHKHHWKEYKS